jgi:hypothetical protein
LGCGGFVNKKLANFFRRREAYKVIERDAISIRKELGLLPQ